MVCGYGVCGRGGSHASHCRCGCRNRCIATGVARADFRLRSEMDTPSLMQDAGSQPAAKPPGDAGRVKVGTLAEGSPRSKSLIAHGFGQNVPLDFAVKQIVPSMTRVAYGREVDQQAAVTWRGGQAWDAVLRAAVAPLGLHVRLGHMVVYIGA